ncbi:hypothetical protein TrRE_jg11, partial [Triparma retinervis]
MSGFQVRSYPALGSVGSSDLASKSSKFAVVPPVVSPSPYEENGQSFSDINWDIFSRSGALTSSETSVIRMAETNVLSYVLADPSDAAKYASALLSCLRSIKSSTEVTHYVLTKILEVLNEVDVVSNPASLFFDAPSGEFSENYSSFKHCLSHRDGWIVKASGVASSFILT